MAVNTPNGAYTAMREHLDGYMETYEANERRDRAYGFDANPDHKRAFIETVAAAELKQSFREERQKPDYDYPSARQAINDWSSGQTKAISTRQELAQPPWDVSDGQTTRGPISAAKLTNPEIIAEVRQLHGHFKELEEQYLAAPISHRPHIREEMQPIVERERALKHEYIGRSQEINQDMASDQLGYSR